MKETDLAFCDSCEYRGRQINGKRCIRTDIDLLARAAFTRPDSSVHIVDTNSEETLAETATSFTIDAMPDMIACAEVVSAGGEPLL